MSYGEKIQVVTTKIREQHNGRVVEPSQQLRISRICRARRHGLLGRDCARKQLRSQRVSKITGFRQNILTQKAVASYL